MPSGALAKGAEGEAYARSLYHEMTEEDAQELLVEDLKEFCRILNAIISVQTTPNQFSALVSLAYNIGVNAFKGSTALRRLNRGDYEGAAAAILLWNKANGKLMRGLIRRRAAEQALFKT
jgi:lysozyme